MQNTSKYAALTKDEAIRAILTDAGIQDEFTNDKVRKAMEEVFREGWLRGEEYEYKMTHEVCGDSRSYAKVK